MLTLLFNLSIIALSNIMNDSITKCIDICGHECQRKHKQVQACHSIRETARARARARATMETLAHGIAGSVVRLCMLMRAQVRIVQSLIGRVNVCAQGGMVAMAILYPLDQIKTIMQGAALSHAYERS